MAVEGRESKEGKGKGTKFDLSLSGIEPCASQPVRCLNPSVPTALPTELRDMAVWREGKSFKKL